jgi:hypothetical protein
VCRSGLPRLAAAFHGLIAPTSGVPRMPVDCRQISLREEKSPLRRSRSGPVQGKNERNLALRDARECDRAHMVIQFPRKHRPYAARGECLKPAPASVSPAVLVGEAAGGSERRVHR